MTIGLVGRKCGMTRVFTEDGIAHPVTVIEIHSDHRITQLKTLENDGYESVQLTYGTKKVSKINKAQKGQFEKAGVEPGKDLIEFRISPEGHVVGTSLDLTWVDACEFVDVSGISKGKGFAGVIKRHNFAMQDATHGNSLAHRAHGSIGQNQSPGKVFKGKKMAGHMGNKRVTIQSLTVVKVDREKGLLLVKGGIPGAIGSDVLVKPAVKKVGA
jgi:large subunit ribosomal protein L3